MKKFQQVFLYARHKQFFFSKKLHQNYKDLKLLKCGGGDFTYINVLVCFL